MGVLHVANHSWIFDDDAEIEEAKTAVDEAIKSRGTLHTECAQHIYKRSAIAVVLASNELEGTQPTTISQKRLDAIVGSMFDKTCDVFTDLSWNPEGNNREPEIFMQYQQHLEALHYAIIFGQTSGVLTMDVILELHGILMKGAEGLLAGQFRTGDVHAGEHQYPPPKTIKPQLEYILQVWNASTEHPILRASRLSYDVVALHPFEDGNGRLSRLLLTLSMARSGFPFFVEFSSGKSKRRQHYLDAVTKHPVRHSGDKRFAYLNALVLSDCLRKWRNYKLNLQAHMIADSAV
jgi:Fic family protein